MNTYDHPLFQSTDRGLGEKGKMSEPQTPAPQQPKPQQAQGNGQKPQQQNGGNGKHHHHHNRDRERQPQNPPRPQQQAQVQPQKPKPQQVAVKSRKQGGSVLATLIVLIALSSGGALIAEQYGYINLNPVRALLKK
jgi:hypothetical protein